MTKDRLEQLRHIEKALEHIRKDIGGLNGDIQNAKGRVYKDSVKGSMTEFPYIEVSIPIEGIDINAGKKLRERLRGKEIELQEMLLELEEWLEGIEDPLIYNIFRLRYRNGLSQAQIGQELGYSREAISKKINKYLR